MNVRRTVLVVLAVTLGLTATSSPAGALTGSSPDPASIHSVKGRTSIKFVGRGEKKGEALTTKQAATVVFSPSFALDATEKGARRGSQASTHEYGLIIKNGHGYAALNGAPWANYPLSADDLDLTERQDNPAYTSSYFFALPGVQSVSRRHYRVTGTAAQLNSLIDWNLSLSTATFTSWGITNITINLWEDSAGRPTEVTFKGQSPTAVFEAVEIFTGYDKPYTITAPKV
jgi:hypothetical protein